MFRNSVPFVIAFSFAIAPFNVAFAEGAPAIEIKQARHDFGEISQGEVVEHTFIVGNAGDAELVINQVRSTCGCTVAEPTTKTVAPGETSEIKVSFNSKGRRGKQVKTIKVVTNDPARPEASLRITAIIVADLDFSPRTVTFKNMIPGQKSRQVVTVKNSSGRDLIIRMIQSTEAAVAVASGDDVSLDAPRTIAAGASFPLEVTLTYPTDKDARHFYMAAVVVDVDGRKGPPLEFRVIGRTRK